MTDLAWWCRDCAKYVLVATLPRSGDKFCVNCATRCELVPDARVAEAKSTKCEDCGDPVHRGTDYCWFHGKKRQEVLEIIQVEGLRCACPDGPRGFGDHHRVRVCPIANLFRELDDEGFWDQPEFGPHEPTRDEFLANAELLRSQLRDLTEELEREKGQLAAALRRADAAEMALAECARAGCPAARNAAPQPSLAILLGRNGCDCESCPACRPFP